jgi:hypothetical protein
VAVENASNNLLVGDLVPSPIEYHEFFVLDVDANASRGVA